MNSKGMTLDDLVVGRTFDADKVEASLRRHGAAVLPEFLSADQLPALLDEFSAALDDDDEEYVYRIDYAAGRAVSLLTTGQFSERYKRINAFFGQEALVDFAHRYVGTPCLPNYEIYATNETNPEVTVAPKHFDKLWTLKYMLYLEDVGPGNAPFGVVPGSMNDSRGIFRSIFEDNGISRLSTSDDLYQSMANNDPGPVDDVIPIIAPAGTLIVFDTDTYHFSPAVQEGCERKILRSHTGPSVVYTQIAKHSRQWWRGEKRYTQFDRLKDMVLNRTN